MRTDLQREYVPAQEQRSCRAGLHLRIMRRAACTYTYVRRFAHEFRTWSSACNVPWNGPKLAKKCPKLPILVNLSSDFPKKVQFLCNLGIRICPIISAKSAQNRVNSYFLRKKVQFLCNLLWLVYEHLTWVSSHMSHEMAQKCWK